MMKNYIITSGRIDGSGYLTVPDENGIVVLQQFSHNAITARTDSHGIVSEIQNNLPGKVVSVNHDGEFIHITCEQAS